jgi:hypothetical protein
MKAAERDLPKDSQTKEELKRKKKMRIKTSLLVKAARDAPTLIDELRGMD